MGFLTGLDRAREYADHTSIDLNATSIRERAVMGKHRVSKLVAGQSTQPEPRDSWMRDLQLQTVFLDPIHWTQGPQTSNWWQPNEACARLRRLH